MGLGELVGASDGASTPVGRAGGSQGAGGRGLPRRGPGASTPVTDFKEKLISGIAMATRLKELQVGTVNPSSIGRPEKCAHVPFGTTVSLHRGKHFKSVW